MPSCIGYYNIWRGSLLSMGLMSQLWTSVFHSYSWGPSSPFWSLLCIFGGLCGRLYTIDYLWLPHLLPTHPFVSTFPFPKASSFVVKSVPPTKSGLSSNADDIVGQPQQWKEFTIRVWCSIENRHRLTSFYATR